MRILLITISFFINCNLNLFSQWSTDPNNNLIVGYGLDPHICSDSAGGCYITYDYHSTSYPRWLALEKLDKYGYKPWGTLKRILGETPEQTEAEIIEDGEGGVIVSYIDRFENLPYWTQRVKVQRVDSNGNFLWGPTGVKVTLEEINQGLQQLVSDGEGGCVIVWSNEISDKTFDYRANRINNLGERVWSDTGIFLENSIYNDAAGIVKASDGYYYIQTSTIYRINQNGQIVNQYYGNMLGQPVADPEGGVVLSGKVWTGQIPKLVTQRKDSLGNNLWQEPYVEIADSLDTNTSLKIQYNDGYFYYGWSGTKDGINGVDQFQALRLDGSKLFPEGSISISDRIPLSVAGIIPSESTKTIFIWNDDPNLPDSTLAQIYDTLGNKIWNENGIVIAHPAISYQGYTIDRNGGFIIGGIINEFTVVAQQVSKYGNLGEIITSVPQVYQEIFPLETILYQNYPNPFNPTTKIKFTIPSVIASGAKQSQLVTLKVYDILGNEIATLVNEEKPAGEYEVEFNVGQTISLSSGIYFYQLKAGSFVETKKMILLK